jgi:hypothetical protein
VAYFRGEIEDGQSHVLGPVTGHVLARALAEVGAGARLIGYRTRLGRRLTEEQGWQVWKNYTHSDARNTGDRVMLRRDGTAAVYGDEIRYSSGLQPPRRIIPASQLWPVAVLKGIRLAMNGQRLRKCSAG